MIPDVKVLVPTLRPMTTGDLERVWVWRNQWRVRQYMFNTTEISWEEHRAWYKLASDDPSKHLMIFEANGLAVGFVNFTQAAVGNIAEWGFYTSETAPKGYGQILCRTALAYGFLNIGLHKIYGRVLEYNRPSLKLHERLGFILEGVLRDGYFDGTNYHSVHYLGMLRSEFQT